MPKSKGRKKPQGRRYQLGSTPKAKHKSSPRWYGPLLIVLMSAGVLIIVLNYVGLIPAPTARPHPSGSGSASGYRGRIRGNDLY